ncbi:MAG: TonB-dependent receptor plug domain-containing protein [Desulfobacterales bacterium]|nr:TonB-dependent receptor plug domain-containing protein [Desulfobacterales bacterium]
MLTFIANIFTLLKIKLFRNNSNNLPVENVKQIEIIRGPGSALYGANAFIGVINIITKDADEIDGLEPKISTGSFNTKKINLIGGKAYKQASISCSADYLDTDGPDTWIKSDRLGSDYSIAPGEADLYIKQTDLFVKAVYGDFSLKGQFTNRDRGSYIGWASALTDENQYEQENYWIELGYDRTFTDFFAGSLKISYVSWPF